MGNPYINTGKMKEENGVTVVTVPDQRREQLDSADNRQLSLLNWFDGRRPAAAGHLAAVLLAVLVTWCLMLVNVSPELTAVPGGSLASIFLLYVVSMAAGQAVGAIAELPELLGMMVAGIVLQNCGLYTVTTDWCVLLVAIMRCALYENNVFIAFHFVYVIVLHVNGKIQKVDFSENAISAHTPLHPVTRTYSRTRHIVNVQNVPLITFSFSLLECIHTYPKTHYLNMDYAVLPFWPSKHSDNNLRYKKRVLWNENFCIVVFPIHVLSVIITFYTNMWYQEFQPFLIIACGMGGNYFFRGWGGVIRLFK